MKKIYNLLAGCMAISAFLACSDNTATEDSLPEFRLVSSISALTRAPQMDGDGAGHFVSGDENSLFFHTAEKGRLSTFLYTYGKSYYWSGLGIPKDVENCLLSACYPPVETSDPSRYDWDVTAKAGQADLLVSAPAAVQVGSSAPVDLSFTHAMHKLKVELHPAAGVSQKDLDAAVITCRNYNPVATLNLLTGKTVDTKGNPAVTEVEGSTASILLPAQPTGDIEVFIRVDGREFVCRLASCSVSGQPVTRLEAGRMFTVKINVSSNSFTVTGQSISGWESQGEFEDSVII